MSSVLIIVESPNKAKKIDEMFAGRYKAIATFGHICDLPSNPKEGIGIDRAKMKGEYELTQDKARKVDGARVVANLKQYLKANPNVSVYLGTDDDREGESISAFVIKYLGLKNPPRMRFNAITKEKIEEALQNAKEIDWAAVSSREARRLIDRVIGYTVSPLLMGLIKQRGVAAGRVQTAVEALVIERERRIRNFKADTYYRVYFDLGGWTAEWQPPATPKPRVSPKPNSEYDVDSVMSYCLDKAMADQVSRQRALKVDSCEESKEFRLPPSPLYTISMIQIANRVLGWAADKTMQVAQKLFEGDGSGHGHITYHRTDSPNIDPVAAEEIRDWLREQGLPVSSKPNTWKCKNQQAQEGHEAIRPSYFKVEVAGANEEQQALYKLIRERAIYSQLAPACYAVRRIVLSDPVNSQLKFTATARSLIEPGWLNMKSAVLEDPDADGAEDPAVVSLPALNAGSMVNVKKSEVTEHKTKASPRYTINTLTSKLEKLSIGRPATIASILKNVQTKGTIVVKKDGKLEATRLAETCYDVLYPRFAFAHIGYTAELEKALDMIASDELDGPDLVRNVWDQLDKDCLALTSPT